MLPGAVFLLGYYADGRPVMGLPGCVMYAKATIFDLVLPRIAAGVRLTRRDFVAFGEAVCVSAVRSAPIRTAASEVCDMSCSVGANSVRPLTAKVITVSDRSFRGRREDLSSPAVRNLLERAGYAVGTVECCRTSSRVTSPLVHAADEENSHSSSPPAAPALHRAM